MQYNNYTVSKFKSQQGVCENRTLKQLVLHGSKVWEKCSRYKGIWSRVGSKQEWDVFSEEKNEQLQYSVDRLR